MPIFTKHKAIFVHIPKTGGTSIEKALGLDKSVLLYDTKKASHSPQHYTVSELKKAVPKSLFSSYFKFAVTRHPVERLVSHFYWNPEIKPKTKERFVKLVDFAETCVESNSFDTVSFNDHLIPQVFYTRDDVDYVGKYEKFQKTIDAIWSRLPDEQHRKPRVREIERFKPKCRCLIDKDIWNRIVSIYRADFDELSYDVKPPKWLATSADVPK